MSLRYNILFTVAAIIMTCSSLALAGDAVPSESHAQSGRNVVPNPFQQKRPEVSSELKVKEKYRFYDIYGSNVAELRKQMKRNGTKWNDGKVYAALTSWDIRYDYDVFWEDGKFSVRSVQTNVDIVYTLPRRISAASGPEMTLHWDNYLASLKQHEFGHKDIAVKTAAEINEMLASLANFGSQSELDEEARRRADEKLRRLKEVQVGYDDETCHGETQGAILKETEIVAAGL